MVYEITLFNIYFIIIIEWLRLSRYGIFKNKIKICVQIYNGMTPIMLMFINTE